MTDAIGIGETRRRHAASTQPAAHAGGRHAGAAPGSFQQVLNRSLKATTMAGSAHRAQVRPVSFQPTNPAAVPASPRSHAPSDAMAALGKAMTLENVPASWQPGLQFLMQKESGGRIGVRNPVHSARGLFQLTRANYHLNPRGEASFGNGVEEAQGGIRYIRQRYGSVDKAVAHWEKHHWY